jgi:chromosome segregation ATPase
MNTTLRPTPITDAAFEAFSRSACGTVYLCAKMAELERERDEAAYKLAGFEAEVAGLRAENDEMRDALVSIRGHLRKQDKSLPTAKEVVERLYAYSEEAKAMREAIKAAFDLRELHDRCSIEECPPDYSETLQSIDSTLKPFLP